MNFLAPLAFVGAAVAVPIVLLYMLRLRRREIVVASTFLWAQVVQDKEANAPWQRLRRNLLLLLQLILLALLVLALARPFITVPAVSATQTALLIDASASMNATDGPNGETRLEAARRAALEVVETLGDGDRMTVIRVADVPEVLAGATGDKNALRDAVSRVTPSGAPADWTAALTLAAAGAAGAEDFAMVVVGDGNVGVLPGLGVLPGEVRYVPVGAAGDNVAISALATRALPGQAPQLFAQLTNYGPTEAEVVFDLRVDGELFTAETYSVPPGGTVPLVSAALPEGFQRVQAGVQPAAGSATPDYLADDNVAYAAAENTAATRALVMSAGNRFLDQVLRSLPGVQHTNGDIANGLPTRPFDLYIFDGWLPNALPANGDVLFINPPQDTRLFTVAGAPVTVTGGLQVLPDALTQYVDFDSVNLRQFRPIEPVGTWAQPLITANEGVLLWAGEVEGRRVAMLTFNLFDSDLPLQVAWPVLMSNLLDWYAPAEQLLPVTTARVGETLTLRAPRTADALRVTRPDGSTRDYVVGRDVLVYAETGQPGLYTLEALQGGTVTQTTPFAVNLFDATESSIAPQPGLALGTATVLPEVGEQVGQREFWPWLAAAALVLALVEWWLHHQRLRGPATGGTQRVPAGV